MYLRNSLYSNTKKKKAEGRNPCSPLPQLIPSKPIERTTMSANSTALPPVSQPFSETEFPVFSPERPRSADWQSMPKWVAAKKSAGDFVELGEVNDFLFDMLNQQIPALIRRARGLPFPGPRPERTGGLSGRTAAASTLCWTC